MRDFEDSADLRIEKTIRFKNRPLYDAIFSRWPTIRDASEEVGISREALRCILSLRTSPYRKGAHKDGPIKSWAFKLSELLSKPIDELFPSALYENSGFFVPRSAVYLAHSADFLPLIECSKESTDGGLLDVEDSVLKEKRKAAIEEALANLKPHRQLVLRRRFGLDDEEPQTLEQIAHELNLSKERVRQIESSALRDIRKPALSQPLYRLLGK